MKRSERWVSVLSWIVNVGHPVDKYNMYINTCEYVHDVLGGEKFGVVIRLEEFGYGFLY